MKKKYYAVHKGLTPGVYETWAQCEEQVRGVPGAKYKAFPTKEEALYFHETGKPLEGTKVNHKTISRNAIQSISKVKGTNTKKPKEEVPIRQDQCDVAAYIDGSFNSEKKRVGYGGIILTDEGEVPFSAGTDQTVYSAYWNISGELLAAMHVIRWALEEGHKSCALYYDCKGIEEWALKKWKRNNEVTNYYADFMERARESIDIQFYKIKAHSGVLYNEKADQLAKAGAHIE